MYEKILNRQMQNGIGVRQRWYRVDGEDGFSAFGASKVTANHATKSMK